MEIRDTIVIPIIAIIGLALLGIGLIKTAKNKKDKFIWLYVGISIIITLFIYTLLNNQNVSNAISALSTIALSIFAGAALYINYRNMKETKEKEKRDRKEKLLNAIIIWGESILLYGVGETVSEVWAKLSDEQKTREAFCMRKGIAFMDIRDRGIKILYMSSYIESDLKEITDNTMDFLQQHIDKWKQAKEWKIKNLKELAEHKSELDKSARHLIEKATSLMTSL